MSRRRSLGVMIDICLQTRKHTSGPPVDTKETKAFGGILNQHLTRVSPCRAEPATSTFKQNLNVKGY
ncbi:hypothetical protein ACTXT7_008173 [Hymenolepis weldensis]